MRQRKLLFLAFWIEEFAAPYYLHAGFDITLASPKGGQPPIDPNSKTDDAQTKATKYNLG